MKKILIIFLLASCGAEKPTTVTIGAIEMKTIPGLTAPDVYRYYEANGFTTETSIGTDVSTWTSLKPLGKYDLVITTTGKKSSEIVAVDAYFKNYTKEKMSEPASRFLSEVSTLSYSNCKPLVAKQWALAHTQNGGDTTIGDVFYRIINSGDSAHILKMSVGEWR